MAAASDRVVTVFGGTGFLGRRIVRHLCLHGFCVRVASRHPDHGQALLLRMIRSFDRSRPTFMMSGQSPMRLLMLTVP